MATKTADKFKCPKCGSGRTKPIFNRDSIWHSPPQHGWGLPTLHVGFKQHL